MSLRLGNLVPNFRTSTTEGEIDFHQWLGDSWGILFSHPTDCTNEMGKTDLLDEEFNRRDVKVIVIGVNSLNERIESNAMKNTSIRSVLIIDPNKRLRLTLTYPATTKRNFQELLSLIDSLQLHEYVMAQKPFPQGFKTVKPWMKLSKRRTTN